MDVLLGMSICEMVVGDNLWMGKLVGAYMGCVVYLFVYFNIC